MNEEIKEMLQDVKDSIEYNEREHTGSLKDKWIKEMYNYITNLQQDLDKANDIIEKDRQFYKCRMDEYIDLKKENEELKQTLHNITINDVEEENTTVLDLINENERLKFENGNLKTNEQINVEVHNKQVEIIKDYKSRCEKAIEYIKSNPNVFYDENLIDVETLLENEMIDEYVGEIKFISTLLNILNGGDENE